MSSSASKRSSRHAMSDMLKTTRSLSSIANRIKQSHSMDDDRLEMPELPSEAKLVLEKAALRVNQKQLGEVADTLRDLVTMAENDDLKIPTSDSRLVEDPTATSSVEAVHNLLVEVSDRRGTYATTMARTEGSLSLGPALNHTQLDHRIAECVSLLCRISPSTNEDINYVGHVLLVANPAESLEAIYHKQLKSSTLIYSGVRDLCAQIGDIVAKVQDSEKKGNAGDSSMAVNVGTITPLLRRSVREVRDAIASQAVIGSASLDLCSVMRKTMEALEKENRGLQYAKMVLTRQLRESYMDGMVIRSQLHDKFISSREVEVRTNAKMAVVANKTANAKVLVMCQVENTYARKLHRPKLFSEALMEVLHWLDMKLPSLQGRRVNYNSALEPKEVYNVETNPILPPESFFFEFPSIGPAVEFCIALQQDLAMSIEWPANLLKIPCFEEVKDGVGADGGEENALQRVRRISNQHPVWRGLRMRAAIHEGLPYVTRPFRGAAPIFTLPNAGQRPDSEITPEDVPHLMGMSVDVTMQLLKKARGGETLLTAKAAESYDALKFQHPDSFNNVIKIPRMYSENKGVPGKGGDLRDASGDVMDDMANDVIVDTPNSVEPRSSSDDTFSGQTFVRPCDRVFAVSSHLLKSREENFYPYNYNDVAEVVFPPPAWWRSTDAQSANLSLFAAIGGKAEGMPSDMEDLTDDDDGQYAPPEAVDEPQPISNLITPAMVNFQQSIRGTEEERRMTVSFLATSQAPVVAPSTPASAMMGKSNRKKRKSTAEYEEELDGLYAQIADLNAKYKQQDDIKSMFAEEIQLLQTKNSSLAETYNATKKTLSRYKARHATCAGLLRLTSKSAMEAEEQVSILLAANGKLQRKNKTLQINLDDLDTKLCNAVAKQRDNVQRDVVLMRNNMVGEGCQTDPDPNMILEVTRGDILAKALRWTISLLSLSTQHVEVITHPSSAATATGNVAYKRSVVTSDIHKRITSFLEDPSVSSAIATLDDRFESSSSLKLVSERSRTKANRVDDLIRTVRKFQSDQVAIEKERPVDPYAVRVNPALASRKSVSGNDYDVYDWSIPVKDLTLFESLRHVAGHVLKTVSDVMSLDQLLQARHDKVQQALTLTGRDTASNVSVISRTVSEQHLLESQNSDVFGSEQASPGPPVLDISLAAQRAREAEVKVKDQGEAILQYRMELAQIGKEVEDALVARDVEKLRVEVLYDKLKEVNAVVGGLRETIVSTVAKIQKEIPNASLIKSKIMAIGGGVVVNNSFSNSSSMSASVEPDANAEFLLTKVLSDIKEALSATIVDFCTAAPSAAQHQSGGTGLRNSSIISLSSGLGGSTARADMSDTDQADVSVGEISVFSSQSGVTSPIYKTPATPGGGHRLSTPFHHQPKRTISNVVTHDLDLVTIMHRSMNDLDSSVQLPRGLPALKTLSQRELYEKDRQRLLNLQKQFSPRLDRIRDKERTRAERDGQLMAIDWSPVIEKQYKREKYLADQVKHLVKRGAASQRSQEEAHKSRLERSSQTTMLGEHRLFKKYDAALEKGDGDREEEIVEDEARREQEFQSLLATMRRAEREQQTDMSCFGRRSCKTQTRRRGTDFVDDDVDEDYLISIESEFDVSDNNDDDMLFSGSERKTGATGATKNANEFTSAFKAERKRESMVRLKMRKLRKIRTNGTALGTDLEGSGKFGRTTKSIGVMTTPRVGASSSSSPSRKASGTGGKGGSFGGGGSRQNLTKTTSSRSIKNPPIQPARSTSQSKLHRVSLLDPSNDVDEEGHSRAAQNSSSPSGGGEDGGDANAPRMNASFDTSPMTSKRTSLHKFLKKGDKSASSTSMSSITSPKAAAKKLASSASKKATPTPTPAPTAGIIKSTSATMGRNTPAVTSASTAATGLSATDTAASQQPSSPAAPKRTSAMGLLEIDSDNDRTEEEGDAPNTARQLPERSDSGSDHNGRSILLLSQSGLLIPELRPDSGGPPLGPISDATTLPPPGIVATPAATTASENGTVAGEEDPTTSYSPPTERSGDMQRSSSYKDSNRRSVTGSAATTNLEASGATAPGGAEFHLPDSSFLSEGSVMMVRGTPSQSIRIAEPEFTATRIRMDSASSRTGSRREASKSGEEAAISGTPQTDNTATLSPPPPQDHPSPHKHPSPSESILRRLSLQSGGSRPRTPLNPSQIISSQRFGGGGGDDTSMEVNDTSQMDQGAFAALQDSLVRKIVDDSSNSPSPTKVHRNRLAGKVFTPQSRDTGPEGGRSPSMVPFLLDPPTAADRAQRAPPQDLEGSQMKTSMGGSSKSEAYAKLLEDLASDADLRREMDGVKKGVVARRLYEAKSRGAASSASASYPHRQGKGLALVRNPHGGARHHSAASTTRPSILSKKGLPLSRAGSVAPLDHSHNSRLPGRDPKTTSHTTHNYESSSRREEDQEGDVFPRPSALDGSLIRTPSGGSLDEEGPSSIRTEGATRVSAVGSEPTTTPAGRKHTRSSSSKRSASSAASSLLLPKVSSPTGTPSSSPIPAKLTPIPKEILKERLSTAQSRQSRSYSVVQRKNDFGVGTQQQY